MEFCRRNPIGEGWEGPRPDKNGTPTWRRRSGGNGRGTWCSSASDPAPARLTAPSVSSSSSTLTLAEVELRDAVYRAILEGLPLSVSDRAHLEARGFTKEWIEKAGYGTRPDCRRGADVINRLLRALAFRFGAEAVLTVPGLYAKNGVLCIAGSDALMIPVRDRQGRISGIRLRPHHVRPGGSKYIWFSSSAHGGPSPGALPHVPLHEPGPLDLVILTEGELKAELATILWNDGRALALSAPGVGSWKLLHPIVEDLRPTHVAIAFDQDPDSKPAAVEMVRRCTEDAGHWSRMFGYPVSVLRWEGLHKGIDDALRAGVAIVEEHLAPLGPPRLTVEEIAHPVRPAVFEDWHCSPVVTGPFARRESCSKQIIMIVRGDGALTVAPRACKTWSCGPCAKFRVTTLLEWLRDMLGLLEPDAALFVGEVPMERPAMERVHKALMRARAQGPVQYLRAVRSNRESGYMWTVMSYIATADLGGASRPWKRVSANEAFLHVREATLALPGVSKVFLTPGWRLPKREKEPSPGMIDVGPRDRLMGAVATVAKEARDLFGIEVGIGVPVHDDRARRWFVDRLKEVARDPSRPSRPTEETEEEAEEEGGSW